MKIIRLIGSAVLVVAIVAAVALSLGLFQAPALSTAIPAAAPEADAQARAIVEQPVTPIEARAAVNQATAPGGPQEGIKVHGDWTIEVFNPDGSLASSHEFQNALVSPEALGQILGRIHSPGRWHINLTGNDSPCLSPNGSGAAFPCQIFEVESGFNNGFKTLNMTVAPLTAGDDRGKITFTGTAIAQRNGYVSMVETGISICPTTTPVSTPCEGIGGYILTRKVLDAPIPLLTGQQALVTVRLSFS